MSTRRQATHISSYLPRRRSSADTMILPFTSSLSVIQPSSHSHSSDQLLTHGMIGKSCSNCRRAWSTMAGSDESSRSSLVVSSILKDSSILDCVLDHTEPD